jgi:hypothetical protein
MRCVRPISLQPCPNPSSRCRVPAFRCVLPHRLAPLWRGFSCVQRGRPIAFPGSGARVFHCGLISPRVSPLFGTQPRRPAGLFLRFQGRRGTIPRAPNCSAAEGGEAFRQEAPAAEDLGRIFRQEEAKTSAPPADGRGFSLRPLMVASMGGIDLNR